MAAIAYYQQCFDFGYRAPEVYAGLCDAYLRARIHNEAKALTSEALRRTPDDSDSYADLAEKFISHGCYEPAREVLGRGIMKFPRCTTLQGLLRKAIEEQRQDAGNKEQVPEHTGDEWSRDWLEKELEEVDRLMMAGLDAVRGGVDAVLVAHAVEEVELELRAPQGPIADPAGSQGLLGAEGHGAGGGNAGQDVREINVLNHYIGMRDLRAEVFTEFAWMPFVLGAIALLFLRAAVHGHVANLVDVVVIFFYFSAFSLASFAYKLWSYGHRLDPTAPVTVEPFMPPLFGAKQLANFEVYSYPALGSYTLLAAGLVVVIAVIVAWRQGRAAA